MQRIIKPAFCVIGKEGNTDQGEGFIQRLWEEANGRFDQVAALAKLDENGNPVSEEKKEEAPKETELSVLCEIRELLKKEK